MSETWLARSAIPIADREQAASEIFRSLSSNYLFGSVVVGKPGVGKTNLLHEVLDGASVGAHIIHLRGTVLSLGKPLSALSFLLNELRMSTDQDPRLIADSLTRHFEERTASGVQTIVVIDNADSLDADSADVIAQLALNRSVKLLIACRDLKRCPPSLMTLWLEGALLRIDLDKLSLLEARALLNHAVQGPFSRSAVHALWNYSAGNARLMQLLVHDFISSGKIVRRGETFVLGRGSLKVSHPTSDAVLAHLGALTDQHTDLLEVLALAGHMPLVMASAVGSIEDLDHLQTIGAINFALDEQIVRADHLVASVIRERVGPFRRAGHLVTVIETHSGTGAPPIHPARFAEWTLECGLPLNAEAGFRGASVANDHDDPETALRIIAGISGDSSSDLALLLETVNAYISAGDESSAARVMDKFVTAARGRIPEEELGRLETPQNRSVRVQFEVARSLLATQGNHPTRPSSGTSTADPGEGEVLLAQVERATGEGRYDVVRSMLEGQQGRGSRHSPKVEIQLKGLLALAYAITDRQHEALGLAEAITESLQSLQLPEQVRARLTFRLNLIALVIGQRAADERDASHSLLGLSGDGTAGELMEGIRLVKNGRPDEALAHLVPAFAQLQVWDPEGLRCLTATATAYSYALRGDLAEVGPMMPPAGSANRTTRPGLPLFASRYFRALALALLGSTTEALNNLRELAAEEFESGHFGLELIAHGALLRLGDKAAAAPLLDAARRTQGLYSELCALFANGLILKDSEQLLEAVQMAESMGHHLFATEITEAARVMAVASGNRTLTRQVQRVIAGSTSEEGDIKLGKQLNLLTPREEEVARLVRAGLSNREMAASMHVSVRTIEGHLYQIYVKLGVNSRSDLLTVLET